MTVDQLDRVKAFVKAHQGTARTCERHGVLATMTQAEIATALKAHTGLSWSRPTLVSKLKAAGAKLRKTTGPPASGTPSERKQARRDNEQARYRRIKRNPQAWRQLQKRKKEEAAARA